MLCIGIDEPSWFNAHMRMTTEGNLLEWRTRAVGPVWAIMLPPAVTLTDLGIEGVDSLTMKIDMVNGTLEPVEITVRATGGTPVTSAKLRQLPIKELTRAVIERHVGERDAEQGSVSFGAALLDPQEVEMIRLRGPVDESLRVAASIYELARMTGLPPAREVEKVLGMPRTTVSKWIRRARDRGFLEGDDGPAA